MEQLFPALAYSTCQCFFFSVCVFSQSPNQQLCHVQASVCLFSSSVSLPCLLYKDFQLHNFQSQGRQLGANTGGTHQNHLVYFPNKKRRKFFFDRKNYKALKNKVNHCGRMPEVDKWRDRNVSTTSAICFLCCGFFFSFHPPSYLLCFLSRCFLCHIFLLYFNLRGLFLLYAVSLCHSFYISVLSLSLNPIRFLSEIPFVRCQRSTQAGCELRESVITNNTKQKRLI